jgi:hypothetical protein
MSKRKALAMEKFQKHLTEHQQKLVREMILCEAIEKAEHRINADTKYRVMPHWSYFTWMVGLGHDGPQSAINNAVFWAHAKLKHLWKVNEDGKTVMVGHNEL